MRGSVGWLLCSLFLSPILILMCSGRGWFRFFSLPLGKVVFVGKAYEVCDGFVCLMYIVWGWSVEKGVVYFLSEFSPLAFS
jgi:hypothetical protein